jgi:predicted RNase H-like nuclease
VTGGSATLRFLGLDLAWRADNPSGAVTLEGARFPLRFSEAPRVLAGHAEALAWIGAQAAAHAAIVGIDAPLLGLRPGGGRRGCDDEISRAFGRFHASTHSPPRTPDLRRWVAALIIRYGRAAFATDAVPGPARPALREVFPHAFQVRLFGLDEAGAHIVKYKRRRFATKAGWARDGLGPFVAHCTAAIGGRYVADGPAWRALVAERPHPGLSGRALKAIEDRWDALLCALAVAVDRLEPGTMRFYPQRAADGAAAILAPVLRCPPAATGGRRP